MLLSDWLAIDHDADVVTPVTSGGRAIVFCSATLAAPDLSGFLRESGLPDALQMVAASPFNYQDNAMMYLPNGAAPHPTDALWRDWVVGEMDRLVVASGGGAFLLFTSISMMQYAAQKLRGLWLNRFNTMVQGEMQKLEIAKRFREDGSAVLFATKSFFEGVSIDGQALRLVIVDKMPFDAPNPLGQAMEADALEFARNHGYSGKALEMYPFDNLRVPKMIIELKQASGRLIRTATDKGVIAVLDSRIRAAQYGRNKVIPALPPAPVLSNADVVADFLRTLRPKPVTVVTATAADRGMERTLKAGRNGSGSWEKTAMPLAAKVKVEDDGDVLWA
jgi:ATP-dependent DNA helicase DinG